MHVCVVCACVCVGGWGGEGGRAKLVVITCACRDEGGKNKFDESVLSILGSRICIQWTGEPDWRA